MVRVVSIIIKCTFHFHNFQQWRACRTVDPDLSFFESIISRESTISLSIPRTSHCRTISFRHWSNEKPWQLVPFPLGWPCSINTKKKVGSLSNEIHAKTRLLLLEALSFRVDWFPCLLLFVTDFTSTTLGNYGFGSGVLLTFPQFPWWRTDITPRDHRRFPKSDFAIIRWK